MKISEIRIDGMQDGDHPFPAAMQCSDCTDMQSVCRWVETEKERLVTTAEKSGAVLFRGFPIRTDKDFDQFIEAFSLPNFRYEDSLSNAVRVNRTERVFTANEAPADVRIFLHHEMAQTPVYPSKLFFFCEQAAEQGGATPLCRSDVLFRQMQAEVPEFAEACHTHGLLYSHVMPDADDAGSGMGRSWRSTWRSRSREEAEAAMSRLGYAWEWLEDGCLKVTTPQLPATRELPDGRIVFFNQLIAAFAGWKDSRNDPSASIRLGNGSPIPQQAMHRVIELADELTFDLAWQNGDVVLVDNYVVMHGRRPFQGVRKVLASLVAA